MKWHVADDHGHAASLFFKYLRKKIRAVKMFQMRRPLLNLLMYVLTVLTLACLVLLPRSHYRYDRLARSWRVPEQRIRYYQGVTSVHGGLQFLWISDHAPEHDLQRWEQLFSQVAYERPLAWRTGRADTIGVPPDQRFGFHWSSRDQREPSGRHTLSGWLVIPLWLPVVLFGALPAARAVRWAVRYPRERRRRRGLCIYCGYDLCATTTGRCPECGKSVTTPATAAAGS